MLTAVGIVCQNRFALSYATLNSLSFASDKSGLDYDLYIIENGSRESEYQQLRQWLQSNLLSYKKLIRLEKPVPIPDAFNMFLELSKSYSYRVVLDSDVIMANTQVVNFYSPADASPAPTPMTPETISLGTNPGAPPNSGPLIGNGANYRKKVTRPMHSRFLEYLTEFSQRMNAQIVSLVPVPFGHPFQEIYHTCLTARFRNEPYVCGGCMLITKDCFDRIGYFDERLPRRIDANYSQRALSVGLNIGYHDSYWIWDAGKMSPTEGSQEGAGLNRQIAMSILDRQGVVEVCKSKWSGIFEQMKQHINDNKIITLK